MDGGAVLGPRGDAEACADFQRQNVAVTAIAHLFQDALCNVVGGPLSCSRKQYHEFVAAVPEDDILAAQAGPEGLADLSQNVAPDKMAVLVIDVLEVVDVNE